jgi:hypothetical protein
MTVLHSCVCLLFCGKFCLAILPVNILCFNQSTPLYCFSSPFSLYPVLLNSFQCVSFSYSCTDVMYLYIIHSLSLFFSFPPPLIFNSPIFGNMFCIFICIYDNSHICAESIFHIRVKICELCLSEPG